MEFLRNVTGLTKFDEIESENKRKEIKGYSLNNKIQATRQSSRQNRN
jgi:hypothetical protein